MTNRNTSNSNENTIIKTINKNSVPVLEDDCEVAEEGKIVFVPRSPQPELLKPGNKKSFLFDDENNDKKKTHNKKR